MSSSFPIYQTLCKMCVNYIPAEKRCKASIVGVSHGQVIYGDANEARQDPKRCGPKAKSYKPIPEAESPTQ